MGPRNKKHKPNSQAAIDKDQNNPPNHQSPLPLPLQSTTTVTAPTSTSAQGPPPIPTNQPSSPTTFFTNNQTTIITKHTPDTDVASSKQHNKSWYNKTGSWRAKASPVAQATRESISVAGGATSEALAEGSAQVDRYMHNTLKRSSKSIPSLPSESRINATGASADVDHAKTSEPKDSLMKDADIDQEETKKPQREDKVKPPPPPQQQKEQQDKTKLPTQQEDVVMEDAPLPPDPTKDNASQPDSTQQSINQQKGWWGWWSRPDGYNGEAEKAKDISNPSAEEVIQASTTPIPASPADQAHADPLNQTATPIPIDLSPANHLVSNNKEPGYGSTRSWFGLWSKAQNIQQTPDEASTPTQQQSPRAEPTLENAPELPQTTEPLAAKQQPGLADMNQVQHVTSSPQSKSAGWAFWSRERKEDHVPNIDGPQRQVGELAVADTPSQSHPEAAQFNQEQDQKKKTKKVTRTASLKETKNNRTTAVAVSSAPVSPTHSPSQTRAHTPEPTKVLDPATSTTTKPAKTTSNRPPHMVMPSFRETYSPAQIPTYWERVTQYVASSLHLIDVPAPQNHVSISPNLPKVKSAVAIGVHGYFPAPLIQKVLGPPTGTSIRFANHASAAIRAWAEKNQPDTPCEIETVALEGEGFIADRVNTLWKLLLNWLSHLRQADLIFVACHSQGVPVAVMLVSKLIQLGCLSPNAKIGICAMAGVNLGPFADYKSRLLGAGSAAELFEFSRPSSKVSMEYAHALDVVLRHSVRITYTGSIDDQLVSLESSTFTTLTHPYVYRCVFVDGRIHAPDFITHLVAFALKLRNLGISDHGLIRELSLPLAGSLYGGQGHSTVYDDAEVYNVALSFTLETTDVLPRPRKDSEPTEAQIRRSSRGGPPESIDAANALRRGSISASAMTGIAPTLAPFELPASGSNANPYFLPWALRGILEEEVVKRDMGHEVKELVERFEAWRPVSKVLKDVRFRLEGVRSKL